MFGLHSGKGTQLFPVPEMKEKEQRGVIKNKREGGGNQHRKVKVRSRPQRRGEILGQDEIESRKF